MSRPHPLGTTIRRSHVARLAKTAPSRRPECPAGRTAGRGGAELRTGARPTLATVTAGIEVTGLRKSFGRTRALDGLDLTVASGEVHGFLGPNGSGKTTTIRILLGLIRADAGTARLLGGDPWREATTLHRRLAYVPGDVTLWPNLSGGEVIDVLGRLRGGLDQQRKAVRRRPAHPGRADVGARPADGGHFPCVRRGGAA